MRNQHCEISDSSIKHLKTRNSITRNQALEPPPQFHNTQSSTSTTYLMKHPLTQNVIQTLKTHHWDYFLTLTFKRKISDGEIQSLMERFTNHYLLKGWVWCREWTTLGYPHLHMVLSVNKPHKSERLWCILSEWGDLVWESYDKHRSGLEYTLKEYPNGDMYDIKPPHLLTHQLLKRKYEKLRRNYQRQVGNYL